ncbi:sulfurtransferase [Mucilaginibacter sp. BT774]|uniref:sulfurtransferase n=1 Tax=Mucilaginibacter sp. BT774 TaxID=3062276 RepID=UPI0026754496|nr:sulfurtransferase [Mucilaginibacter sp. BT774]MDO3626610.1 sulfurtransferase [Mucilaginibacter sp. BT774]
MSPLIEIEELRSEKGPIILIDARAGADARQRYDAGHLEGAQFADLDKDLALLPQDAANGGRHPLPPIENFAKKLGGWGITPDSHVVVYDDKAAAFGGARLWWMLRAIGHKKVQVLNGGLKAAVDAGLPLSTEPYAISAVAPYPVPANFAGTVDIEETGKAAKERHKMVIDVRETPRYLGQMEPIDLIAGHIPGAENLPYTLNLDEKGKYKSPEELEAAYTKLLGDVKPDDVIVHCGSGVTACHTLLGMEYAGIKGPKMYVGSWSEWSRRDLPIATDQK